MIKTKQNKANENRTDSQHPGDKWDFFQLDKEHLQKHLQLPSSLVVRHLDAFPLKVGKGKNLFSHFL
jgi:hypothetical protein